MSFLAGSEIRCCPERKFRRGKLMKKQAGIRDLDVFDFEVLLAVSEAGSFRAAGGRLNLGQSGVSRRIQKLEELVGVSIFERRPSGARLTDAGWDFVGRVRAIQTDLKLAIEGARSAAVAESGRLRIGLIASLSRGPLRELIVEFSGRHVDVAIRVMELERSELLTLLNHREIDAVIATGEPKHSVSDALLLHHESIYLAMNCRHPLARGKRLAWSEVAEETFVVSAREPGPEIHDYITRNVTDLGRKAEVIRFDLGREGIMNLVGLGFGVSLVADHWRGVRYPDVTFVAIGDENEQIPFSLTWRPDNDNPALRRFVSLARVRAKKAAASPSVASQSPDRSP